MGSHLFSTNTELRLRFAKALSAFRYDSQNAPSLSMSAPASNIPVLISNGHHIIHCTKLHSANKPCGDSDPSALGSKFDELAHFTNFSVAIFYKHAGVKDRSELSIVQLLLLRQLL